MKFLLVLLFAAHGLLAQNPAKGLFFYPVQPCRAVNAQIVSGVPLPVMLRNVCGIPRTARAVTLTVTISAPTVDGSYTLDTFPAVDFGAGETVTSCGTFVPVLSTTISDGQAQVFIDVEGYFQ